LAKNGVVGNSFCLVAQCRVIGTCLAGLRKNDVPKDLEHFWMGHEDEEIGDRYSKLKDVVAFRKELLEGLAWVSNFLLKTRCWTEWTENRCG